MSICIHTVYESNGTYDLPLELSPGFALVIEPRRTLLDNKVHNVILTIVNTIDYRTLQHLQH